MSDLPTMILSRRKAMMVLAALATQLGGCRTLSPYCPNSPSLNAPDGMLTIDVHAHVFNGSDLPVRDFISKILIHEDDPLGPVAAAVGGLLQDFAWTYVPSGREEIVKLKNLQQDIAACSPGGRAWPHLSEQLIRLQDEAFTTNVRALREAARQSHLAERIRKKDRSLDPKIALGGETALQEIDKISEFKEYDKYRMYRRAKARSKGIDGSVSGLLAFVIQNFQYRYVTVHDYLFEFDRPTLQTVDLVVPAMVDFSWWISCGEPTRTPLQDQIGVMEQIAILTQGRVHCYVPFDPLHEIAYQRGLTSESSFETAMDGLARGCIGVKLYLPMGFAPGDNAAIQADRPDFWQRDPVDSRLRDLPDLGKLLDAALERLYCYCEENGVPIMAHTGASNAPNKDFAELTSAAYWTSIFKDHPGLRVNFGHFGNSSPLKDSFGRAAGFIEHMREHGPGRYAFADSGYFSEVLDNEAAMAELLERFYGTMVADGTAPFARRFMYGTDWEMLEISGSESGYMDRFRHVFVELMKQPLERDTQSYRLAERFFGLNAADFLGLHKSDMTRQRLMKFYEPHQITPQWSTKLDQKDADPRSV
jgi:predicted TIM-barrel fold metal-dependent hydrolase